MDSRCISCNGVERRTSNRRRRIYEECNVFFFISSDACNVCESSSTDKGKKIPLKLVAQLKTPLDSSSAQDPNYTKH